ncbi:MAG: thioesterase family protein [Chloroflexi bacterium]|nr:thioesterase family protein [Chloroflexota bacterium]
MTTQSSEQDWGKDKIKIGLQGEARTTVNRESTAGASGTGRGSVLSTPSMIGLMENAALTAVDPLLASGWGTVGTAVSVRHLRATPLGKEVVAQAELVEIDRRRLVFKVEASDPQGKVGEGTHERFIVSWARFGQKG